MGGRGRWVNGGFVALAVPLVALCTLGVAWRYAAVTAANVVPLAALAVQRCRRPAAERPGWTPMLVGMALLAVHNGQNQVSLATAGTPATGALSATTMALGYLLLLAGGAVATSRLARRDRGGMLDAAVIGLAAASLMWGALLRPAHVRLGSGAATVAYEMCLVLLVTGLTGMVVRILAIAREARTATLYLLVAIVAAGAADVVFTLTEDTATGLSAWWASALCVVALIALAAALVHPASAAIAGTAAPPTGLTSWRLAFLGAALAANPALAAVERLLGRDPDVALLATATLVTVPLVVARIGLLARRQAEAERRLLHLATRDDLTGLPNRRATIAHLDALLDRVAEHASPGVVVLYLDLDAFKAVNDTHGHASGDRLLQAVAARLLPCADPAGLVARFGGDEFVVVLEGDPATTAAAATAAVERTLAAPVTIGGRLVSGRASVGVATAGQGERCDAETLLGRADADMYRAKHRHRTLEPECASREPVASLPRQNLPG